MRVDQIEIHAGAVDFEYEPVRRLEAKCEAKTAYSKAPTMADANLKLQEMASQIGANAVVDVTYNSGMSLTSWRSMKATGLAIRKLADDRPCPSCAEMIKRAAVKCRFCGVDLAPSSAAPAGAAPSQSPAQPVAGATTAPATVRSAPSHPRFQEPLKSTDNSQMFLWILGGVVVLLAILFAVSQS